MTKLNGYVLLKQAGKRMGERDLEAPCRVSITTPSGDVFRWIVPNIVVQPNGNIQLPLPDMEPVR